MTVLWQEPVKTGTGTGAGCRARAARRPGNLSEQEVRSGKRNRLTRRREGDIWRRRGFLVFLGGCNSLYLCDGRKGG